jgi:murein L,D-transpeptidase YcbB/YkuD
MKAGYCFSYHALALAVAGTVGGFATPAFSADAIPNYTFCVKYPNSPGCPGYVPPVPAHRAAPQPAAAPAPEQPKERTVVVAEPGPPPNNPGECYTKVLVPAEFRDEPMQQLVQAAGERVEYSEAVYEEVEEQVLVKPASKKVTVVPAEYGEVEERVLVREAYRREIEVPALYNTYYERVMETPARDVWKPGRGAVEMVDPSTGEILCLVHEEATYKTVERKELARAASKRYEEVPAEYATVKKTVLLKPESIEEVEIPAEYETIKVRKLVRGPEPVKVPVEATYTTVNKQVMVQPEREEWAQVLCDVNATPGKILEVERALGARGYSVNQDGQIDAELTGAVRSFQQDSGLRPTGIMTADTLTKLGVTLN